MPRTVAKILDMLSTRIVEKYKPVIIGVFDDEDGTVCEMMKGVLEKRYDVRLSGPIREPDKEIPYAVIGTEEKKSAEYTGAMVKGLGLALRKYNSYPNVLILTICTKEVADMKRLLALVRPDIAVFAAKNCQAQLHGGKKPARTAGEKAFLLRCLKKKDYAVFCADDLAVKAMTLKSRCSKMTFGFTEEAKVRGKLFSGREGQSEKGTCFKISYRGTIVPFHFPGEAGEKEVCAALAVSAVALHMGFNLVEISEALRR